MNVQETHRRGVLSIENLAFNLNQDMNDVDFGVQIHSGQVWVCLNGTAFLRFKPHRKSRPGGVNADD